MHARGEGCLVYAHILGCTCMHTYLGTRAHQKNVQIVDYDPVTHDPIKRTLVATGSWDRSIKIWNLETKEIYHDLGGSEETNTSANSYGHQNTVR
jgi:WD40 repeat protein